MTITFFLFRSYVFFFFEAYGGEYDTRTRIRKYIYRVRRNTPWASSFKSSTIPLFQIEKMVTTLSNEAEVSCPAPTEALLSVHPTVSFYKGQRNVELTVNGQPEGTLANRKKEEDKADSVGEQGAKRLTLPVSGQEMKEFSCWSLHFTLLPPPMVYSGDAGESTRINDEFYSKSIASSDGCELLRVNWYLLLHLLLPCAASNKCLSSSTCDRTSPIPTASPHGDETSTFARSSFAHHKEQESRQTSPLACDARIEEEHDPPPRTPNGEPQNHDKRKDPIRVTSHTDVQPLQVGLRRRDLKELNCPSAVDKIHYSIIVFLRFYGWRLHDDTRGEIDRHQNWRERYALLRPTPRTIVAPNNEEEATIACKREGQTESFSEFLQRSPKYGEFDFYTSGLPHFVQCFLGIGFITYAIGLVEFVIEEMKAERLTFLIHLVSETLLPELEHSPSVDSSHISRLRRKLKSLLESDSE